MKTILLIEDHEIIRENTAELLELTGYRVLMAENGKVGVEKALAERPDLVICDIMMPVLDGYGVLHIFNQNAQLAGVPFIFLTAKTERADLRRGMELGADDNLTKPVDESELLTAVAGRLARFQHLRPDVAALASPPPPADPADAQRARTLAALTTGRRPHATPRRQIIYAEGDEPARLYYVQAGRVKTTKATAAGKELITSIYQAGEFFGYQALLERQPHHDSAVAVEDSTLLYIPAEEFTDLLRQPEASQQLIRLLAGREREREQQLVDMAYNSLRRRVADTLLRLHTPDQPGIQLAREDLAAVVGTAPESLSRTLSEFRQAGLIELTPTSIRVLQPEGLRRANW
jgi:CRP-like cAMP-binding protein